MCTSKILDFAAFWNEEKHKAGKTAHWHFLFPNERWAEAMQTVKRNARIGAHLKSTCTNKRTRKKALCISKYAQFSFLCYVASLHFPTVIHSEGGKRTAMWEEGGAGFQARSRRKCIQRVQWESSDLRSNTMFDLSALFLPVFFYFSTGLLFLSRCLCSVLKLTTPCGHTKVKVNIL